MPLLIGKRRLECFDTGWGARIPCSHPRPVGGLANRIDRLFHPIDAAPADYVDWGGTSKARMNEWVTTDALFVLNAAGRL